MLDMKDFNARNNGWTELIAKMQETELKQLPENMEFYDKYKLSENFYARMQRLCALERQKVRHARIRGITAAAAALVFYIAASHPYQVASCSHEVMTRFKNYTIFQFDEDDSMRAVLKYEPAYVPSGYKVSVDDAGSMQYSDGRGGVLFFDYMSANASITVDHKSRDFSVLKQEDGRFFYCYEAVMEDEDSVMIWLSQDENTVFKLQGRLSKEEMLKTAQGVRMTEKDS